MLLGAHRVDEVQSFLEAMRKKNCMIPIANSCVLIGYYEGGYYRECCSFYRELTTREEKCPIIDPRGYYSALLSAYRLQEYGTVIGLYQTIESKKFWPSREVVYTVTEVYSKGDFWRKRYDQAIQELQSPEELSKERLHYLVPVMP